MKKRKVKVTVILIVAFIFALFLGIKDNKNNQVVVDTQSKEHISYKVKDNKSRIKFINFFGWQVNPEPIEVVNIIIPQEFGDVYKNYNEIQKKQGLDLEKFKGKEVTRYTYKIKNYPKHKDFVHINLLIYKNKVIGGDVCSVKIDGFIHGFDKQK